MQGDVGTEMAMWWMCMRKIPSLKGKVHSGLTKMGQKEASNFQGEFVHVAHLPGR